MTGRLIKLLRNEILALRGLEYGILRRRRNLRKAPIKLYWWHDSGNGIVNFGDEITKDILLSLFGYRTEFATQNEAELVGAGSILEIVSHRTGDHTVSVWGSGFMWKDEQQVGSLQNIDFYAVRGTYSRDRLSSKYRNVALGDPGLLANVVYKKSKERTDKIGVVVHFVDANEPMVKKIKEDERFVVIDPLRSPQAVALDITSCRFVLSSSLHGLIFADSFNVPNAHIQLSGNVAGGTYKFADYYSATGRAYRSADSTKIFESRYLDGLGKSYRPVVNLRNIQKQLIRSFPPVR